MLSELSDKASRKPRRSSDSGESAHPYGDTAAVYLARGWDAPLPLPARRKETPPEAYTGRGKPYPTRRKIRQWSQSRSRGNICLRMGSVDVGACRYDVVGIDVDHYLSGGRRKRGGTQLRALEAELGKLPPTWCSTARSDGRSGIRFYLAPHGHLFVGKAAPDIDIISPGYRYAVVWPSVHPDGMRYRLYPPGQRPDGKHPTTEIPRPDSLPMLPPAWFERLTLGGRRDEGRPIDVDSTTEELLAWARDTLPGFDAAPCTRMLRDVDKWLSEIANDPSSHDKIQFAHWNLLSNAVEGHTGWPASVQEVETYWRTDVVERGKRSSNAALREIARSKITALRKLKAATEEHTAIGLAYVASECSCATDAVIAGRTYRPREPRAPRTPTMPRRYGA